MDEVKSWSYKALDDVASGLSLSWQQQNLNILTPVRAKRHANLLVFSPMAFIFFFSLSALFSHRSRSDNPYIFQDSYSFHMDCLLYPYPRPMSTGTDVPQIYPRVTRVNVEHYFSHSSHTRRFYFFVTFSLDPRINRNIVVYIFSIYN